MPVLRFWLSCAIVLGLIVTPGVFAAEEIWPQGLQCARQNAPSPLVLADEGRAEADIVLLSDGELLESAGGRKTVAINGRVVAEFVRTGPPVEEKKEWWVTRCYPIPERLLKNGKIEIRFTDPGVAVAEVVLSAEPVPDTK